MSYDVAPAACLDAPDVDRVDEVERSAEPVPHEVVERVFDVAVIFWAKHGRERRMRLFDELVRVLLCLAVKVLYRESGKFLEEEASLVLSVLDKPVVVVGRLGTATSTKSA